MTGPSESICNCAEDTGLKCGEGADFRDRIHSNLRIRRIKNARRCRSGQQRAGGLGRVGRGVRRERAGSALAERVGLDLEHRLEVGNGPGTIWVLGIKLDEFFLLRLLDFSTYPPQLCGESRPVARDILYQHLEYQASQRIEI